MEISQIADSDTEVALFAVVARPVFSCPQSYHLPASTGTWK